MASAHCTVLLIATSVKGAMFIMKNRVRVIATKWRMSRNISSKKSEELGHQFIVAVDG